MQEKEKVVRWRYYIDKKFQNQFMIRFSLLVLLVLVFTLLILWILREDPYTLLLKEGGILYSMSSEKTIQCVQEDGTSISYPVPVKTYNAFELYWKPIVFVSFLNLAIIIVFSLFYSHSMAGPIYNIKKSLNDMVETGQYYEIKIRKTDQFQELVEVINKFIQKQKR